MEFILALVAVIISLIIYIIDIFMSMSTGANTYSGHGENHGQIEREYFRYTYVARVLERAQLGCNKKQKYEAQNIIERWLLSMTNFAAHNDDPIFSREILDIDHKHNRQMADEFEAKLMPDEARIADIITIAREYFSVLPHFFQREKIVTSDYERGRCNDSDYIIDIDRGTFEYRDYSRTIMPERMKLLVELGGKYATARMLMRYACILPGSQHWNAPRGVYEEYIKRGIMIESFASPVNAQMIAIDKAAQFCSIFPDTDKPFGSIGSFFTTNFAGKSVGVGPPYTAELFDMIADKVIAEMDKGLGTRFYITFAAWEDAIGYIKIRDSKYTTFAAILPAGHHKYEDSNNGGREIVARFNTVFFVMGESGNDYEDYCKIFEPMAVDGLNMRVIKQV